MDGKSRVSKWGASLAVRIPKRIAEKRGVQEAPVIETISQGDHVLLHKKGDDLADMPARMNACNLHPEHDTGSAPGREEW